MAIATVVVSAGRTEYPLRLAGTKNALSMEHALASALLGACGRNWLRSRKLRADRRHYPGTQSAGAPLKSQATHARANAATNETAGFQVRPVPVGRFPSRIWATRSEV